MTFPWLSKASCVSGCSPFNVGMRRAMRRPGRCLNLTCRSSSAWRYMGSCHNRQIDCHELNRMHHCHAFATYSQWLHRQPNLPRSHTSDRNMSVNSSQSQARASWFGNSCCDLLWLACGAFCVALAQPPESLFFHGRSQDCWWASHDRKTKSMHWEFEPMCLQNSHFMQYRRCEEIKTINHLIKKTKAVKQLYNKKEICWYMSNSSIHMWM